MGECAAPTRTTGARSTWNSDSPIVAEISDCKLDTARAALDACGGNGRAAVLHLVLGLDPDAAKVRAADQVTLWAALTS